MKNRFLTLLVALLMLAAGVQLAQAQASTDQNRGRNRPIIEGGVESVGGRLQISLSNTDDIRSVSGSARISLGASGQQSEKVEFTLAPQESRLFPLGSRGEPGDNYTLTVIEQAGAVIFIKNAPVKRGAVAAPIVTAPSSTIPVPAPAATIATTGVKELTVKARLTASSSSRTPGEVTNSRAAQQPSQTQVTEAPTPEQPSDPQVAIIKKPSANLARRGKSAEVKSPVVEHMKQLQEVKSSEPIEAPVSDEPVPLALLFEITTPAPIINASLSVNAGDFKKRQAVTVQGSAKVEFIMPDDFEEPKINYTLTNASGQTLAQGELILEDLRQEDSVTFTDIKFDKETYDPGDSVHLVVTLEGASQFGYRLEVTAKDANTETLLSDSRKGVYSKGKSIQEFRLHIPAEARGSINVEFKAFGNLTRRLFGFVVRDIVVNDTN